MIADQFNQRLPPAARLMLEMMASTAMAAAASLWQAASAAMRAEVGRRVFLTTCGGARSDSASLTPEHMTRLAQQLFE